MLRRLPARANSVRSKFAAHGFQRQASNLGKLYKDSQTHRILACDQMTLLRAVPHAADSRHLYRRAAFHVKQDTGIRHEPRHFTAYFHLVSDQLPAAWIPHCTYHHFLDSIGVNDQKEPNGSQNSGRIQYRLWNGGALSRLRGRGVDHILVATARNPASIWP